MNGERGGREAPSLLFNNIVKTALTTGLSLPFVMVYTFRMPFVNDMRRGKRNSYRD